MLFCNHLNKLCEKIFSKTLIVYEKMSETSGVYIKQYYIGIKI